MTTENLTEWMTALASVSDGDLLRELAGLSLDIDDDKFAQALSAYACTEALARIDLGILRSLLGTGPNVSDSELDANRWRAAFVHRAYTAFVYMRSEHLEKGLDSVAENSPIRAFRNFFRAGCQKRGEDTVAQHIRNSLCHGSFIISRDFRHVTFTDRDWTAKIDAGGFYNKLCEQVKRFYLRAFEAQRGQGRS